MCVDAAWTQKAIEQNGLELQTIHLILAAGCFFLYFKIDPFHGYFSEMNLFSAEFTVDSVHHPPASTPFHFFNQRLCVGLQTSAVRFKPPGGERTTPWNSAEGFIPDPHLTSHSMWCFPTHPPALIPPALSLRLHQALSHLRVFIQATPFLSFQPSPHLHPFLHHQLLFIFQVSTQIWLP